MDSLARLNTALDQLRRLRKAVEPFSKTATARIKGVEAILECEIAHARRRRERAAEQI